MHTLVIYDTTSGNTRAVAEAIAEGARTRGTADLLAATNAGHSLPATDLLILGAPTERHTVTPAMIGLLERLGADALRGRAVATFDTRLRWPRFLSGSAADEIGRRVELAGARLVARPESFIVSMKPALEPGELERAEAWAADVSDAVAAVPA
ncbi:MAG TPA: flavodoxin domain-containing protein [Candidatus Limnocylindria bacterium]|jgi:flavodoxin|nr:flavodoxin domain-containing protein [Candidatus Limnocylindria bacterium]